MKRDSGRFAPEHGHAKRGGTSRIYWLWRSMRSRCENKNDKNYNLYGGRGIYVCERWLNFENFLADMGEKPAGKSLDRINNDGPYSPENCRWATHAEQHRNNKANRFLTFGGVTLCLADWADRVGLKHHTLQDRLLRGWSLEKALTAKLVNRGWDARLAKMREMKP